MYMWCKYICGVGHGDEVGNLACYQYRKMRDCTASFVLLQRMAPLSDETVAAHFRRLWLRWRETGGAASTEVASPPLRRLALVSAPTAGIACGRTVSVLSSPAMPVRLEASHSSVSRRVSRFVKMITIQSRIQCETVGYRFRALIRAAPARHCRPVN